MKHFITLAAACLVGFTASAQKNETSSITVSTFTQEDLENAGKFEVNLAGFVPTGKGAEWYSAGISLGVKYNIVDDAVKVYTSQLPISDIERLEVLKDAKGPVIGSDAIAGVINVIKTKESTSDLQFYGLEEHRWNVSVGLGYDHLFGKEEDYGQITYKYDPLDIVYLYVGYVYRPCERANFELNLGPGTAIYSNGNEFGYRFGLNGSYDLKKPAKYYAEFWEDKKFHINTALTLGISYNKYNEVDGFTNIYGGITARF